MAKQSVANRIVTRKCIIDLFVVKWYGKTIYCQQIIWLIQSTFVGFDDNEWCLKVQSSLPRTIDRKTISGQVSVYLGTKSSGLGKAILE